MNQRGRKSAAALAVVRQPEPPRPVRHLDPPAGLGQAGAALWRHIVDAFELNEGEREVLAIAAASADRAESLRRRIDADGAVTYSDAGVPKAHPGIKDETAARALAARLLARLGVAS